MLLDLDLDLEVHYQFKIKYIKGLEREAVWKIQTLPTGASLKIWFALWKKQVDRVT